LQHWRPAGLLVDLHQQRRPSYGDVQVALKEQHRIGSYEYMGPQCGARFEDQLRT
jgi:hypothetical protein